MSVKVVHIKVESRVSLAECASANLVIGSLILLLTAAAILKSQNLPKLEMPKMASSLPTNA
jgi:hypothetical protein